jgi:hypothetical protein
MNEPSSTIHTRPPFTRSYALVFLLMVVSLLAIGTAGSTTLGRSLTLLGLAATTWLSLRVSQVQRPLLRLAQWLIPPLTVVAIVVQIAGVDDALSQFTFALIDVLLIVVAPLAIVRQLARQPVVSLDTFFGAATVYLLIAMFFSMLYSLIGTVSGDPFFVQTDSASPVDYLYFSFTTITTVGYGDFTAAGGLGRMTAMMEAILGQLYLITVVAVVVQNLGQARRRGPGLRDPDDGE